MPDALKNTLKELPHAKGGAWICFSVIALFVLAVYAPSLMHSPRADQVAYFAEIANKSSFVDLTWGALDLNRHRHFNPGDEVLFRPILYFLLGAEKYFFGWNFMLWQGVGIVLHLLVVRILLGLLLRISPGWPAVVATAFFALLFTNIEMVVWQHINGYLILAAAALMGLKRFFMILDGGGEARRDYMSLAGWLILAAFTYEMGVVLAFFLASVLWARKPASRPWVWMIWAVPGVYAAASVLDAALHPVPAASVAAAGPPSVHLGHTLLHWFQAVWFWMYTGLFPSEFSWDYGIRIMISEHEGSWIKPVHLARWPSLTAVMILLLLVPAVATRRGLAMRAPHVLLSGVMLGMVLVFAAVVAHGRGQAIDMWSVLRVNTYYLYVFWVFVVIGLFAWVDWTALRPWHKRVLCSGVLVLVLFNAGRLYAANAEQMNRGNNSTLMIKIMNLLIQEHGREPDFSFYMDPRYPGNYALYEIFSIDDPTHRYTFAEALYLRYFKPRGEAKYKFLVK